MFNKEFWVDVLVRAVKTGAQAAIALLGTNAVGVLHWDWLGLASVVAGAMVMSVLSSLVSLDSVGKTDESDPAVTEPGDDPEDVDDSDVVEGDDADSYVEVTSDEPAPEEAASAATVATESVKQFY